VRFSSMFAVIVRSTLNDFEQATRSLREVVERD
jgi:hypothetical protein